MSDGNGNGLNGKTKWIVGGSSALAIIGALIGYTNSTSKDLAAIDQRIVKNQSDIAEVKETLKTMSSNRYKDTDALRDFNRVEDRMKDFEFRLRQVERERERGSKP